MLKSYTEDRYKTEGWSIDHTIRIVVYQGILYYYDITNPDDTLSEYPLRPMEGPEEELTSMLLLDLLDVLNREVLELPIHKRHLRAIIPMSYTTRIITLRALKAYIEGLLI